MAQHLHAEGRSKDNRSGTKQTHTHTKIVVCVCVCVQYSVNVWGLRVCLRVSARLGVAWGLTMALNVGTFCNLL